MKQGCIVVTGASRGIGAAIAEFLANAGYTVGCLSRSGELPAREQATPEARALWIPASCDITDRPSVLRAFALISGSSAVPIVGLVNNAGIHLEGKSESFAAADFERVMSTNASSVFSTSQIAFPYLEQAGSSAIVNIGSFFDRLGVKRNAAYAASKAAVGALTRCLAVEWAARGIRVLNVAPGYIQTDLNRAEMSSGALRSFLEKRIPRGQPGNAEDVAELVAMLFALPGSYLTGETIYLDGAQAVAL